MGIFDILSDSEETKRRRAEQRARELYQIEELEGKMYLTYLGNPVCPCDMFKEDAIQALLHIRELHVKRQTGGLG